MDSRVVEPERSFRLVDGDLAGDLGDIAIERTTDVVVVAEDECLVQIEADRDDVLRVAQRKLVCLLGLQLVFEEELLIICEWCQSDGLGTNTIDERTGQLDD